MAGGGGSGGSGGTGSSGGANKVGNLLLAGGLALLIVLIIPVVRPDPAPTPPIITATPAELPAGGGNATPPPASTSPPVASPPRADRATLVRGYPADALVLTVIVHGMPGRVTATFADGDVYTQGVYVPSSGGSAACLPDAQYPEPCISYWVAKRGAAFTLTAGNALAGFWSSLDHVRGPGCDIGRVGARDESCNLTLGTDLEYEAVYYGSSSADGEFTFPKCPRDRGAATGWIARCQ